MKGSVQLSRQVPLRPWRWNPPSAGRGPALLRQYPMRAGSFVVRTDTGDPWADLPVGVLKSAPLDRAFYLADVDEVDEQGRASLSLWEAPSGRALYGSIGPLAPNEREGPEPAAGDRLLIWTWRELPGAGQVLPRRFVRVERRALSDEDRQSLLRLAQELEAEQTED